MNSLYQKLNSGVPAQARQMASLFKSAKSPETIITNMIQNNPKLKPIMDMVRNGSNPKDLFYNMAQQKGVDPESVLSLLR